MRLALRWRQLAEALPRLTALCLIFISFRLLTAVVSILSILSILSKHTKGQDLMLNSMDIIIHRQTPTPAVCPLTLRSSSSASLWIELALPCPGLQVHRGPSRLATRPSRCDSSTVDQPSGLRARSLFHGPRTFLHRPLRASRNAC